LFLGTLSPVHHFGGFVVFLVRLAIVREYTAPFKSSLEPFNSVALQGTLNHLIGHDGLPSPTFHHEDFFAHSSREE
jgi:hypothetical protein